MMLISVMKTAAAINDVDDDRNNWDVKQVDVKYE